MQQVGQCLPCCSGQHLPCHCSSSSVVKSETRLVALSFQSFGRQRRYCTSPPDAILSTSHQA